MGLKFQKDNSLDRRFDEFAFFPDNLDKKEEKVQVDIERFLKSPEEQKDEEEQKED